MSASRCEPPCSFSLWHCFFYVVLAVSYYFSGLSEIDEARSTARLRDNNVTRDDSFGVNATEWTLKPDSLDEILLAVFSRGVARAAKAWTVAPMLVVNNENRKQD